MVEVDRSREDFPAMSPADFDAEKMSEADMEKQAGFKQEAADALENGDLEKALELFTEAIKLGTDSAMLYAKRAQVLFQLSKWEACANDCNAALELNSGSAKAFRIRARTYVRQEKWLEAHLDFAQCQALDFDDEVEAEHNAIKERAKQAQEKANKDRLADEKAEKVRLMQENKKKYEEDMKNRDAESREERMAAEKRKEEEKEAVKQRNRERWAKEEEEKRKAEEEEEIAAED